MDDFISSADLIDITGGLTGKANNFKCVNYEFADKGKEFTATGAINKDTAKVYLPETGSGIPPKRVNNPNQYIRKWSSYMKDSEKIAATSCDVKK